MTIASSFLPSTNPAHEVSPMNGGIFQPSTVTFTIVARRGDFEDALGGAPRAFKAGELFDSVSVQRSVRRRDDERGRSKSGHAIIE